MYYACSSSSITFTLSSCTQWAFVSFFFQLRKGFPHALYMLPLSANFAPHVPWFGFRSANIANFFPCSSYSLFWPLSLLFFPGTLSFTCTRNVIPVILIKLKLRWFHLSPSSLTCNLLFKHVQCQVIAIYLSLRHVMGILYINIIEMKPIFFPWFLYYSTFISLCKKCRVMSISFLFVIYIVIYIANHFFYVPVHHE